MSPRRAPGESRQAILDAARRLFGEVGYQGATIRRIARDAGVDPALVIQYFGSKDGLLEACLEVPLDVELVLSGAREHGDLGTELVRRALRAWEEPRTRDAILSLIRTGLSHERAAEALSALISRAVLSVVQRVASGDDAPLRAALAGSQMAGLIIGRVALRVPALVEADADRIAAAVGPTITRYLVGDLTTV
ncbi:TetR family transcriptional regulator [Actinotalea sp. M2MS4P-6]|uniref:TetR/AcrR family transcriptional regulator n=1 Tax=Actinotalea sp. M2MS4P-6 TaxID=2983762 RepID=UPI0021E4FEFB|nr:TetR family transcriptional regulator [Actinotalea sp. M2MS4P-6]MCV2393588.1 TetR family transcriptional regulator [Actinotalea sp. M2MS4P-6]